MNFCNQLVIVGGGGFIGCSLVSRIQEYDIDLICVSKTFQWGIDLYKSKNIKFVQSEAADVQNYIQLISHNALIVYMAGSTDLAKAESNPTNDLKVHFDSLLSLLSQLSSNQRLIFLSSAGTVYGEASLSRPSREYDLLQPKSIYGHRNKLLENTITAVCTSRNIDYLILRLANPYGLEQMLVRRTGLILSLMASCIDQRLIALRGDGLQKRDFFSVDDLCFLIFQLMTSPQSIRSDVVNVASGVSYAGKEVASLVEKFMGKSPRIEYKPDSFKSDVLNSSLDRSKLDQLLLEIECKRSLFQPLENGLKKIDFAEFRKMCKNFKQLSF